MILNPENFALEDAKWAIEAARLSDTPIVWITGNSYMPPIRSIPNAEECYKEDDGGEAFELYVEAFEEALTEADVLLDAPDWDNALYVVDLKRWTYTEDEEGEDLNDDWEATV
jgi:hypothetical protein